MLVAEIALTLVLLVGAAASVLTRLALVLGDGNVDQIAPFGIVVQQIQDRLPEYLLGNDLLGGFVGGLCIDER